MKSKLIAVGLGLLICALLAGCSTPSQPARTSRDTWDSIQIGAVEVGDVREDRNEDGEAWAHYTIGLTVRNDDDTEHAVVVEVVEVPQQPQYDCGNGIREGCNSMFVNKVECAVPARSTEVCRLENNCYWPRLGPHCSIVEFAPEVVRTEIVEMDGFARGDE